MINIKLFNKPFKRTLNQLNLSYADGLELKRIELLIDSLFNQKKIYKGKYEINNYDKHLKYLKRCVNRDRLYKGR